VEGGVREWGWKGFGGTQTSWKEREVSVLTPASVVKVFESGFVTKLAA
jgi:hypothetical protein